MPPGMAGAETELWEDNALCAGNAVGDGPGGYFY